MATVALIIPWRPGDAHREAAWDLLKRRHLEAGRTIIEGTCPPGPWCKAAAVSDALQHTDADTLVIIDADVWCDGLDRALDHLDTWAIPHRRLHRLDPDATGAVLAGHQLDTTLPTSERPYNGFAGGGIVILRRTAWDIAPLDHRFTGWGHEDSSWALALTAMLGRPWRGSAPLFHLWHPPQERDRRHIGSAASKALYRRYQAVARNPRRMAELIDEGRRTCTPST